MPRAGLAVAPLENANAAKPPRLSRVPRRGLGTLLTLFALGTMLTACGTRGNAAALPPVAHTTLVAAARGSSQPAGLVTLTPRYGGHLVPYLGGYAIPYQNAKNPVQLRDGGCAGPVLAALTADAPGPSGGAAQSAPATRQDAAGGADVALAPDQSWTVVVLDRAGDPAAKPVACGHPLSGRQQYFDLYPPDIGSNGTARGMALLQPIITTRVEIALTQPAAQEEQWTIHRQSCDGATVAAGQIASGATKGGGTVFAPPDTGQWWVSVAPTGSPSGAGLCGKVGG
ncbi:MAG: hypothetical protein IVW57_08295 [Ktedonobacterales bacterium]|nr:hypothetical protein [Ktedonobacterales bacterium]